MKKFVCAVISMMALVLTSCSNEDGIEMQQVSSQSDDVTVAKISDYIKTGSRSVNDGDLVLQFKNRAAYERVISKLNEMDEDEKLSYFESLGFEGAYTTLLNADRELDAIFDSEADSITVCNMIQDYLNKYQGNFAFNEDDTTDVTPNLSFDDEDAALVGNVDGYVVIGNEILAPEDNNGVISRSKATKANPQPVYNGKFIKFDRCTLEIKNGKYKSTISMGRMGSFLAFHTETYKKILFFKKKDKNAGHNCKLTITRGNNRAVINVKTKCGDFRTGISAYPYSPTFNVIMENFWSTRGKANATKSFYNVIVKG